MHTEESEEMSGSISVQTKESLQTHPHTVRNEHTPRRGLKPPVVSSSVSCATANVLQLMHGL